MRRRGEGEREEEAAPELGHWQVGEGLWVGHEGKALTALGDLGKERRRGGEEGRMRRREEEEEEGGGRRPTVSTDTPSSWAELPRVAKMTMEARMLVRKSTSETMCASMWTEEWNLL